jgi:hypothetical protein
MQVHGVNYFETYAPVASLTTIRLVTTEAFMRNMSLCQLDICSAYLYGTLPEDEIVYMKQPKGFIKEGQENDVCQLVRSIYGLKQAGHRWHHTFVDFLKTIEFKQCIKDFCVFILRTADGGIAIIIVYVDDLILAANSEELRLKIKGLIMDQYKTRYLGELNFLLGMRITRTPTSTKFDQTAYLIQILHEFSTENCKPAKAPMLAKRDLEIDPNEPLTNFKFGRLHGMFQYLANATRPT